MPAEKLYLLDLGWLAGDIGWFLPGARGGAATKSQRDPPRRWVEIPISAGLIEHKDARVLFDCGTSLDAATSRPMQTENFPLVRLVDENRLENQLGSIGYKVSDIDFIVLSHLHWDHVGQLPIFRDQKTPIIVQRKELEWALFTIWLGKGGYYDLDDLLPAIGNSWFPIEEKTLDLLDGVTLNFTGGHTPGHQIAKVTLRSGKTYILTGDYLHIPEEYETESKGWLLSDQEEWLLQLRRLKLEVLSKRSELIISHDPTLWDKFPRAPKALQ